MADECKTSSKDPVLAIYDGKTSSKDPVLAIYDGKTSRIYVVNGSEYFNGSVSKAIQYFKTIPYSEIPITAVYSQRFHQWYITDPLNKTEMIISYPPHPSDLIPTPIEWLSSSLIERAIPHIPVSTIIHPPKFNVDDNIQQINYLLDFDPTIYVFDFDCTLTSIHTNGIPDKRWAYFSPPQISMIERMFRQIKETGNIIIILTRGSQKMISEYLHDNYLILYNHIHKIIGAKNEADISKGTEEDWAIWKTDRLIMIHNTFPSEKMVFLDDTLKNVEYASRKGFKSFHVTCDQSVISSEIIPTTNIEEIYKKIILESLAEKPKII